MSRWGKVGIVLGGYGLAFVAALVAGHLYNLRVSAFPYDTSGGMYAAGEAMSSLGAFLVVALAPTLAAFWFLRGSPRAWLTIAVGSLGFAVLGLIAVLMPLVYRETPRDLLGVAVSLLGLAQLLGVPFWLCAFALFAVLAPTRRSRRLLLGAVGLEVVIGVCAAIHWLMPRPPF